MRALKITSEQLVEGSYGDIVAAGI
jgi:hypothetical protein